MAYATVTVTNNIHVKKAPIGFSWTVLFFGFFVPLFRQDWVWVIGMILLAYFTAGLSNILLAFFYNKWYINSLLNKGYKIHTLDPMITKDGLKAYTGYFIIE